MFGIGASQVRFTCEHYFFKITRSWRKKGILGQPSRPESCAGCSDRGHRGSKTELNAGVMEEGQGKACFHCHNVLSGRSGSD